MPCDCDALTKQRPIRRKGFPRSVTYNGTKIEVLEFDSDSENEDGFTSGYACFPHNRVLVNRHIARDVAKLMLWHELYHLVVFWSGVQDAPVGEEIMVRVITDSTFRLLIDNPKLARLFSE